MRVAPFILIIALSCSVPALAQKTQEFDPNSIHLSPYRHQTLPPELLKRIRATTDVFEKVDGMTFEQVVDLYKRDLNPEENLVLWEEMARAYTVFCKTKCSTAIERTDVYRALLLRTMLAEDEAVRRTQPKALSLKQVRTVVKLYRLAPKPITVVKAP
jgi:hypothetical protein